MEEKGGGKKSNTQLVVIVVMTVPFSSYHSDFLIAIIIWGAVDSGILFFFVVSCEDLRCFSICLKE